MAIVDVRSSPRPSEIETVKFWWPVNPPDFFRSRPENILEKKIREKYFSLDNRRGYDPHSRLEKIVIHDFCLIKKQIFLFKSDFWDALYFIEIICNNFKGKTWYILSVSDDDEEYDEGVHVTMPEDDVRRASDVAVLF